MRAPWRRWSWVIAPVVERRGALPELVADRRLEPVGAAVRGRYRQHLRDGYGFDDEFAAMVAEVQLVERRDCRNREGGFWVAGALPRGCSSCCRAQLAYG
jgi:hypothetical protein